MRLNFPVKIKLGLVHLAWRALTCCVRKERQRERERGNKNPHVRARPPWGCEKTRRLKKTRARVTTRGRRREAGWYAEVVFVRATINSAGSVLPPKTYRNKYAVRPVRGWAAALYSNAVHMEQFITLQHGERKRENSPRFSMVVRAACASFYPPLPLFPYCWIIIS